MSLGHRRQFQRLKINDRALDFHQPEKILASLRRSIWLTICRGVETPIILYRECSPSWRLAIPFQEFLANCLALASLNHFPRKPPRTRALFWTHSLSKPLPCYPGAEVSRSHNGPIGSEHWCNLCCPGLCCSPCHPALSSIKSSISPYKPLTHAYFSTIDLFRHTLELYDLWATVVR